MNINMAMIKLEKLSVGYGRQAVLSGLDVEIPSGTLVAMVGCNGCGKSTLMRTIAGLQPALSGEVLYSVGTPSDFKPVSAMSSGERSRTVAVVNTEKIRIPGFRCRDLVALGRAPYTDWAGRLSPFDEEVVAKSLDLVGLGAFADRTMDTISDGECQMVLTARAIAQNTPVILLDEPTAFLDYPNRVRTVRLLKRLASEGGRTIVWSTHDIDLALKHSDLVLLVASEGVFLDTPQSAAFATRLSEAFRTEDE